MLISSIYRQRSILGSFLVAFSISFHPTLSYDGNQECIEWIPFSERHQDTIVDIKSVDKDDVLDFTLCKTLDDDVGATIGVFHPKQGICSPFSSSSSSSFGSQHDEKDTKLSNTNTTTRDEFKVAKLRQDKCMLFWKQISFDVNPLNSQALIVAHQQEEESSSSTARSSSQQAHSQLSLCKKDNGDGSEIVGIMVLSGPLQGQCIINLEDSNGDDKTLVGGGYLGLSAWPLSIPSSSSDSSLHSEEHQQLYSQIEERVDLYLTEDDKNLISKITSHPLNDLMRRLADTKEMGTNTLRNVLTTTPFVPSRLNEYGLSLLRSLLAERMTKARRRYHNLHHHPDTEEWEANGVLLKDFDYYTDPSNAEEFKSLLAMCGAVGNASDIQDFEWSAVKVVSYGEDPQQQAHVDTFHSVVKMWVYEKGVITLDHGPLHFMRGSTVNGEAKLRWIYNITMPPALDAIKESSLRYRGNATEDGMSDILRPVLPLDTFQKTLIIADTSGIHHRGYAEPGTVRHTYRVQSGLDGGLKRVNPFTWDGWNSGIDSDEVAPSSCMKTDNELHDSCSSPIDVVHHPIAHESSASFE